MMGVMDDTQENEKVYTLMGAAAAAGVSAPTIRRRKEQLIAAGAVVDPKGWRVPHSALIAAGFDPSWSADEKPQEPLRAVPELEAVQTPAEELRDAHDRIRRLESENMILRHHVEKWEMAARERLDSLNDMRVAFRALAMSRPQPELQAVPDPAPQPAESHQADEPRRGWWSRMWT